MIERLREYLARKGPFLLGLLSIAVIFYQVGRLFRAERAITGGELSLPLDDSFIYLQYAQALATGHPFVYSPGNAPTTGATSLLWPFILALPHLLHLGPTMAVVWALALGMVAMWASALLLAKLGRALGGMLGMVLAVAFFLANPYLLWGYMSGMEIPLYATVLLAALLLYVRESGEARFPKLRWWLFVLAASRPEGAVLSAMFGIAMIVSRWRGSRSQEGPRFLSASLLLPFAAAAIPFLVNLLVSGSIESTSSQAKSILSEPHPDVLRHFLGESPGVWLTIGKAYLTWFQLLPNGVMMAHYAVPSAIAFVLFVVFSFWPKDRPWADGRVVFLLFPAAVIVGSLPIAWSVHCYRYQQGLYPVVLACYAAGLGRGASQAWEHLPRKLGGPLAALCIATALWPLIPSLGNDYNRLVQFYGHNCENILHQQVKVGRWIDLNLPRNAVVGINDAGAVAYYGKRSTLDMLGLTTEGFAKVYRAGIGCLFERLRRLPPDRKPTYFAIYLEWFPYLKTSGVLGPESFRAHLGFNTICGGDDKIVFPANWVDVTPADVPALQHPETAGMKLHDSLDLAWLEDELRHEWSAYGYEFDEKKNAWNRHPTVLLRDVLRQYAYTDRPTRPVTDGGRMVFGWERFRVSAEPGKDLVLLMRTDAWYANRLTVSVDGKNAGLWTIARSETAWVEPSFRVPGRLVTGPRPEIEIRRDDPKDGSNFAPFHYWIYQ